MRHCSEFCKTLSYNCIFKLLVVYLIVFSACSSDQTTTPEQKGTLVMNSNPSGAEVFINGTTTQKITPDSIELEAGTYSIKLVKPTYIEVSQTAVIEISKTTKIDITLQSGIMVGINSNGTKIYFSYQFNVPVNLESITLTRPTSNNSNYVVYSELLNNATINPNNTYRFPQSSTNDFNSVSGNYTFVFKGFANSIAFENEVIFQLN